MLRDEAHYDRHNRDDSHLNHPQQYIRGHRHHDCFPFDWLIILRIRADSSGVTVP